ncbi:MAG TPA: serine hydrolase domain-containing protein [Bryobacteraceae bacterium]|nr:serine hydrolase domain-containing protein [Bryobacteraceae bacterium]
MGKQQFRALYREFLFRMVDWELLSAHAQGDSHRLLGQFASLLIFLSLLFSLAAHGFSGGGPAAQVFGPFIPEHFLIATTMLVVGLFAVLSWDSTFPDRRDVLVLAPLPVRPRTLFLAKIAGVATALAITVATLHSLAGLIWPLALGSTAPALTAPALTWQPALPPMTPANLKSVMDRDLAPALSSGALASETHGGLVIGIVRGGEQRALAYGTAKADSIFEMGSVSKTFTALILARLAAENKVWLDEPVRELLPPGAVNKPPGAEITLLDIATHHSGLPYFSPDINIGDKPNPEANYHAANMFAYLGRRGVARPAIPVFSYSNYGYGLLGMALAERAGMTYPELLRKEIAEPLGLQDTAVWLSPEQQTRMMQAYGLRNLPVAAWELDAYAPAGAVRSSAADMLAYLEAQLHPEKLPADFAAAIRNSQVARADVMAGYCIALAWIRDDADGTYWHDGAISGYTTYAFFRPQSDYAGVVLFNHPADAYTLSNLLGEHLRQRLAGEPAVSLASVTVPPSSACIGRIRWFAVYWIAMAAAGAFIFCCVLAVQGIAAQLLPRRWFLRVSSFLQLAAFATLVGVYFTQPMFAGALQIEDAQGSGPLSWSPSYWFLGLMQQLRGSPALAPLARRAWIGLAVAVAVTAIAYALSYFRTLRRIVEEPDIVPGARRLGWLPPFGSAPETAIVQFSIRTLLRSRQHRVILAFYLAIGFAMTVFLLRTPAVTERLLESIVVDPLQEVSIPILASTLIMMMAWVVGTRVLFSMPMDLGANWLFRITSGLEGARYQATARRSLLALAVIPCWLGSAAMCFALWPWRQAAAHVVALGLFGTILADVCTFAFRKIPFTCSYLPGKSQVHMVVLGALGLLYFTLFVVRFERDVLQSGRMTAALIATLLVTAAVVRWRAVALAKQDTAWLRFEDAPGDEILTLGLSQGRN